MILGDNFKTATLDRDGVTVSVEGEVPVFYPWSALAEAVDVLRNVLPAGEYMQKLTGTLAGYLDNEHVNQFWQIGATSNDTKHYLSINGECKVDNVPMFAQTNINQPANSSAIVRTQVGYNYNGSNRKRAIIVEFEANKNSALVRLLNNEVGQEIVFSDDGKIKMTKTVDGTKQTRTLDLWALAEG